MKAAQESMHTKTARRKAALAVLAMVVFVALYLAVIEAIAWVAADAGENPTDIVEESQFSAESD